LWDESTWLELGGVSFLLTLLNIMIIFGVALFMFWVKQVGVRWFEHNIWFYRYITSREKSVLSSVYLLLQFRIPASCLSGSVGATPLGRPFFFFAQYFLPSVLRLL
jgi:hypothetical protein